jgi:hypothetical protein
MIPTRTTTDDMALFNAFAVVAARALPPDPADELADAYGASGVTRARSEWWQLGLGFRPVWRGGGEPGWDEGMASA